MSSEAMHYSEKEGTLSVGIVLRCYNQPLTEPITISFWRPKKMGDLRLSPYTEISFVEGNEQIW